jgi:PHD/YefM family antitoxin component YafN of YafNO toxin-antitoxin module
MEARGTAMHHIQLNDQLYQEAQRRATEAGFGSVDEYFADMLQHDLEDTENLDHFFTPERLAHIDRSIAQIEAGQGLTSEQAKAELARRRDEWLRQNPR